MNSIQHEWNVTPAEAIAIQKTLRDKIILTPLSETLSEIKTIAGVDVSLNLFSKDIYAGVIVLSYPDLVPIEYAVVKTTTTFPYIPGLLSFREIPALLQCFEKLSAMPDVIMADGQGIAHPRRLGIAAHLGAYMNIPTLGCGKSRLYGDFIVPTEVGAHTNIYDPRTEGPDKEIIGTALKSKARSNPLIISPGYKMTVQDALNVTLSCLRGYRLPEPTRRAHELVNKFRKGEIDA